MPIKRDRLTLANVADEVGVHVATVWRWVLHGVKGRKLRSILIGGRRAVLRADLDEFLEPRAERDEAGIQITTPSAHEAGEKLDRLFASGNGNRRSRPPP